LPVHNPLEVAELDELYWFIGKKPRTETRENVYLITMVNREPRQIVGHDVSLSKSRDTIQNIVDNAPHSEKYYTDGYAAYAEVDYYGTHIQNFRDKSNTFTVEGINADIRHYIPLFARRSRCFARSLETLKAVMEIFVDAYNAFGEAKQQFRRLYGNKELPFSLLNYI
jgi:IS1 family transposase